MSLRTAPYWLFALLTLTALHCVWRSDVLIQRPYGTSALGVFTQASSVVFADVESSQGSAPAALQASFVPWLLAGLMQVLPAGTPVIIVFRILGFAAAALIALVIVGILHKRCTWSGGAIAAAAVLTMPVFTVQAEIMGQEIFMIAAVVVAFGLLMAKQDALGALAGLLAFLAKWTGGVYFVAAILYLLFAQVTRRPGERSRVVGMVAHVVCLPMVASILWLNSKSTGTWWGWVPSSEFGTDPISEVWRWCPDLLILAGLAVILGVAIALPKRPPTERSENEEESATYYGDLPLALSTFLVAGMAGLLATVDAVPGNLAYFTPFVVIPLAWVLLSSARLRPWGMAVFFVIVGVNLVNSHGRFFPSWPEDRPFDFRTSALRERSREYLTEDHRFNVDAVRAMVEACRDRKIIAPAPFVQFLSLPALGYVYEPFEGYSLGGGTTTLFREVETIRQDDYRPAAFVFLKNRFVENLSWRVPAPEFGDQGVYPLSESVRTDPAFARSPILVFVPRKFPSERPAESKRHILSKLWPADEFLESARQLATQGNYRGAKELLARILEIDPKNDAAQFEYAFVLQQEGKDDAALAEYAKLPESAKDFWQAQTQSAMILMRLGQLDKADEFHGKALRSFRERLAKDKKAMAQLLVRWGTNDLARERYGDAIQKFLDAVAADPEYAVAQRELGFALLKENRLPRALVELESAVELDREDPITHRYLGATYAGLKNWDRSAAEFREALRLMPDDNESLDGLTNTLMEQGKYDEAISEYEDALARRPSDERRVALLVGMSDMLKAKGDWQEAISTLREALTIDPKSRDAANQLAWILATAPDDRWRNGKEAVATAKTLLEGEPTSIYLDTLAAVFAEAGQWDKAVELGTKSIELAEREGRTNLVPDFAARVELYKRQQPYRDPSPEVGKP